MSPLKRKRPHDAVPESPPPSGGEQQQQKQQPSATRRATRHTQTSKITPLPWQADPEPRRRRRRPADQSAARSDDDKGRRRRRLSGPEGPALTKAASLISGSSRGRAAAAGAPSAASGRPPHAQHQPRRPVLRATTTNQADWEPGGLKTARKPHHYHHHHQHQHHQQQQHDGEEDDPEEDHGSPNGPAKLHVGANATLRRHRRGSAVGPIVGSSSLPPPSKHPQKQPTPPKPSTAAAASMTQLPSRSVRALDHVAANTSKPFAPPPTTSAQQRPPKPAKKQQPAQGQEKPNTIKRNIDKVVFGNVCFSTWYHSPYGTEALGEKSGNSVKVNNGNGSSSHDGSITEEGLSNNPSRKTKEDKLDRLYVCPCCFKYSKELVPWWQHVHLCERRNYVPGDKIYTHPKGRRTRRVTDGAAATVTAAKGQGRKRKAPDSNAPIIDEAVVDQGEWSIWQVDGEKEGLFCQNLSLFAKLFLDNKSVFFDVVLFNYFLLVYTAPRQPQATEGDDPAQPPPPPRHQIVGFFSKEKLSWDNNNLACILIFPPWQRKGLGALLMGVSYEISRREGMLGGPEKPISDLGKKGYKRFWAGEIAAWILSLDTTTSSGDEEEVVVDAEECSRATWIVQEDCLAVLREMGIVEDAGMGPPKPAKRSREVPPGDGEGDGGEAASFAAADADQEQKEVRRVRITKDAVWNWVRANGISLEKACDPDGFVEGYAIKQAAVEEEDV